MMMRLPSSSNDTFLFKYNLVGMDYDILNLFLAYLHHYLRNGIAVLDPAPLYNLPAVRFRMARIMEDECSASECSLICNDYWEAGYGRVMMVPRVKLAYDGVRAGLIYSFNANKSTPFPYHREYSTSSTLQGGI